MSWTENKKVNWELVKKLLANSAWGGHYSNYGPAVQAAEVYYREQLKIDSTKAVIYCNSGTSALHTAYLAIKKQDDTINRVLTTPFNFPSSANGPIGSDSIIYVDLDDNFEFPIVKDGEVPAVDIVIVPNYFGLAQDVKRLEWNYSNKKIIFDNAASPYTFVEGRNISNFGTASIISFHHTKPIGFGEGGLLIIDKEYEETARRLINFGNYMIPGERWDSMASNFKASDIDAAFTMQYEYNNIKGLYYEYRVKYLELLGTLTSDACREFDVLPNHATIGTTGPSCLPIIWSQPTDSYLKNNSEIRKYYKPLVSGYTNCDYLYEHIMCIPCNRSVSTAHALEGLLVDVK